MAAPQVENRTQGVVNVASTTWTLSYPTGSSALVCAAIMTEGTPASTWPGNFTKIDAGAIGQGVRMHIVYDLDAAALSGTFDVTLASSVRGVWWVWRFSGAHATTVPETGTRAAFTSSTSPDPPALSPSWGAEDSLYFALTAFNSGRTVSSYPTNYVSGEEQAADAGAGAVARREAAVATEDPSVFTLSAGGTGWAQTMGIRAAAAGGAGRVFDETFEGAGTVETWVTGP